MKLLLDANISWRLAANLKNYFDDCFHVDRIDIAVPASDNAIWKFAIENKCTLSLMMKTFCIIQISGGFLRKLSYLELEIKQICLLRSY